MLANHKGDFMKNLSLAALLMCGFFCLSTTAMADAQGLVSLKSAHSVSATMDKLEAILKEKGMNVFARINHSEGAKKAEMELRPTELLIFGNPKVGTPLMLCSQTVAIDLPQKALAWEDASGQVWLSYNDPEYLNQRHGLGDCAEGLKKVSGALNNLATAATAE
jgi:uncharacterized protein (DUF302 family)